MLQSISDQTPAERKPLAEFTIFKKLPTELRLKIWKLAAISRIVDFPFRFENCASSMLGALQACQESRRELRHKYTLYYSLQGAGVKRIDTLRRRDNSLYPLSIRDSTAELGTQHILHGTPVFIDCEKDIFHFPVHYTALKRELLGGGWSCR